MARKTQVKIPPAQKIIRKRSQKLGLPPGSLVYLGEHTDKQLKVSVLEYSDTLCEEYEKPTLEECHLLKETPTITWINVDGLRYVEDIKNLGECLGLHPLVLEDILSADQRPKLEDYGDYLYMVLRVLRYDEPALTVRSDQLSLVIGANYLISLHDGNGDLFAPIKARLKAGAGRIRKGGPDYLAYTILDLVVDNYFLLLESIGETIEDLEQQLISNPTPQTLGDIHRLKRDLIILRRSVWPLREVMSRLERRDSPLIQEGMYLYLKDVYDHVIQVIDTIETFRDMLSGMLDIYLSSVSNRMNEVMKVLTIIATIFIPLTFIAGVYGMNFKHMPELEHPYGYYTVLGVMIALGLGMLGIFWKKGWLGGK